jgi:leucyl-tRNA synthetase
LKAVDIVQVAEGGKKSVLVGGGEMNALPQVAEGAVPGVPTFHFENVK